MADTTSTPARRIVNPVQNDVVTWLETSEETGGERTLIEVEVAPGGGTEPHYHKTYDEHFEVLEGALEVLVGEETRTLHAWSNPGSERAVAHVELRPGQPGFETSLRVAYGLAADGLVLKNGMPRNPLHAALLLEWGDGRLPGAYAVLERGLRLLAAIARRLGMDRALVERYA